MQDHTWKMTKRAGAWLKYQSICKASRKPSVPTPVPKTTKPNQTPDAV
jgi:hypothetical protein